MNAQAIEVGLGKVAYDARAKPLRGRRRQGIENIHQGLLGSGVATSGDATSYAKSSRASRPRQRGGALRINADFALFALCGAPHNRKNWLFCGSELAGKRAAIVMSLVQSAKLNGHDPWRYLRDVLARLPTQLN